jgi:hypothetical protein
VQTAERYGVTKLLRARFTDSSLRPCQKRRRFMQPLGSPE